LWRKGGGRLGGSPKRARGDGPSRLEGSREEPQPEDGESSHLAREMSTRDVPQHQATRRGHGPHPLTCQW